METRTAWSKEFLDGAADPALCLVLETHWNRIHRDNETAKRIFARCTAGDRTVVCALGEPIRLPGVDETDAQRIFLPSWALDHLGLGGSGEDVEVEWCTEEYFPEATRIVLRPHDSAFYHANARDELEPELTRFGVLVTGTTILVPISELGGFVIPFDVVKTEPANIVLMEGDEVALEFEAALDEAPLAAESPPPVSPVASRPLISPVASRPLTPPPPDEPMIPMASEPLSTAPGHRLGGTIRRMPDGRPWNPWR